MSKQELYMYSLDGEDFRSKTENEGTGWETREEALAAGREQSALIARLKATDPSPVWTGVKVGYQANAFFPSGTDLIEAMSDVAEGEIGGEPGDDWPDVGVISAEAEEGSAGRELHDFMEKTFHPFLETWTEKHELAPLFWSVTEVVKHADDDGALVPTEDPA